MIREAFRVWGERWREREADAITRQLRAHPGAAFKDWAAFDRARCDLIATICETFAVPVEETT